METAGSDARRFFVVPDRSRPLIARADRSPFQLWPKRVFQPLGRGFLPEPVLRRGVSQLGGRPRQPGACVAASLEEEATHDKPVHSPDAFVRHRVPDGRRPDRRLAGSGNRTDPRQPASRRQRRRPPASKPETVEQRIATLKTALKITPDQEPKWTRSPQAMRDNASHDGKAGRTTKRAIPPEKHDGRRRPEDLSGIHRGPSRRAEEPELGLQVALRLDAARPEEERRPWCSRSYDAVEAGVSRVRRSIMTAETASHWRPSLALGTLAFAGLAAPASAAWWGDGRWHEDNRWHDNNPLLRLPLPAPPVIYAHAVQLRLLRAAGGLRQRAGLLDHHPAVRAEHEGRRAAMPAVFHCAVHGPYWRQRECRTIGAEQSRSCAQRRSP